MQYTRLYADADGESHCEDVAVELSSVDFAPPAPPLDVSRPAPADQHIFFRAPAGWDGDWYPAPRRQLFVGIAGELDVEMSDGEVRRFGTGDVALLEDVSGKGHVTRVVGAGAGFGVFVRLPPSP